MQIDENPIRNSYLAVGVMSGTSLDGLDLVLCQFEKDVGASGQGHTGPYPEEPGIRAGTMSPAWKFRIIKTRAISYSGTEWPEKLVRAENSNGFSLMEVHRDFGKFTGEAINKFLEETAADYEAPPGSDFQLRPDFIASHGHTVFHRPERGITLQIGDGAAIAATTGITTISDFRRLDVALGGQGAPLVPVGDDLLFGQYDYCLNLGGFTNISFRESGKRLAFDICPANIVLNRLAQSAGHNFDKGGRMALSGKVIHGLLERLESLEYYSETGPRSLGKEWVDEFFMPVVDGFQATVEDKLRTVCEHIALRIASALNFMNDSGGPGRQLSMLVTGGGAKNRFLTKLINGKTSPAKVVIPEEELIDFKEALVFAFLGLLRLRNEANCLASVTGAARDNSGGIIHLVS